MRETFQNVNVDYVNRNNVDKNGGIEYSIHVNKKGKSQSSGIRIKNIGGFLRQAKYYNDILPIKIPLRKTDISPADWQVERYVFWERQQKNNENLTLFDNEIAESMADQSQFNSNVSGSIFDDPPDVNSVVTN